MSVAEIKAINKISFCSLSFGYEHETGIFEEVDYEFPVNNIVHVYGEEGKSSLMKLLAALKTPAQGDYRINDESVTDMSFEEFLPYRLAIGYSFDYGGLINNRTLEQNLMLPLLYHNICEPDEAHRRVTRIMGKFGLLETWGHRPSSVSGSQRKACSIARAFLMEPEFLLLDDPTTGIGTDVQKVIQEEVLKRRNEGRLKHVYVATDDASFVQNFATEKLVIKNRKIQTTHARAG